MELTTLQIMKSYGTVSPYFMGCFVYGIHFRIEIRRENNKISKYSPADSTILNSSHPITKTQVAAVPVGEMEHSSTQRKLGNDTVLCTASGLGALLCRENQ